MPPDVEECKMGQEMIKRRVKKMKEGLEEQQEPYSQRSLCISHKVHYQSLSSLYNKE